MSIFNCKTNLNYAHHEENEIVALATLSNKGTNKISALNSTTSRRINY